MKRITEAFSPQERLYLTLFFLLLWAYLFMRAIYVPLTHDEAATFFYYVQPGSFLPWLAHWDANNHILNSGISILFFKFFGSSELSLRLSNLVFFPLFCYYIVSIAAMFRNRILRIMMIAVLCLTQHFIQFFALSRGYGMSVALLIPAVFHLMQYARTTRISQAWLMLFFITAACMANLTLLPTFAMMPALCLLIFLISYRQLRGFRNLLNISSFLVVSMTILAAMARFMFELKSRGCLYYGSADGFWKVTVRSLSAALTDSGSVLAPLTAVLLFSFIIAGAGYLLLSPAAKKQFVTPSLLPVWLLAGNIAAILILGKFLHVNYPEDRTGMYLFVLLVISLFALADDIVERSAKKYWIWATAPLMFFPLHFMVSANISDAVMTTTGRIPPRFMQRINSAQKPGQMPFLIGGREQRTLCWSYQNYRNAGKTGVIQSWNFLSDMEDYQLLRKNDFEPLTTLYDSIDYDMNSGLYLLKRKMAVKYRPVDTITFSCNGSAGIEFTNLLERDADTLSGKAFLLDFSLTVNSSAKPFNARIVVTASDAENHDLIYASVCLDWLRSAYTGDSVNFRQGVLISSVPVKTAHIRAYIWNLDKEAYQMTGQCTLKISDSGQ